MQIKNKWKTENRKWKINSGVTIIELLIYLALLTIFLTVLLDIFVNTLNFKLQSESASALNQDSRYIFEKMSYDIYNSDSFSVPSSTELDFVSGGITNKYTILGGNLLRNSDKLNGLDTKVGEIEFTKIGTTISVLLTLDSQINLPGGVKTQGFETTLQGR